MKNLQSCINVKMYKALSYTLFRKGIRKNKMYCINIHLTVTPFTFHTIRIEVSQYKFYGFVDVFPRTQNPS